MKYLFSDRLAHLIQDEQSTCHQRHCFSHIWIEHPQWFDNLKELEVLLRLRHKNEKFSFFTNIYPTPRFTLINVAFDFNLPLSKELERGIKLIVG
jgi:hypothetical protein